MDYVCDLCGAVFNESEAATETFRHDEVRPTYTESFVACPHCLTTQISDAAYCYRCRKPMKYEDLKGGYYCLDCLREITNRHHEHRYIWEDLDNYAEWLHEKRARNHADEEDYKLC